MRRPSSGATRATRSAATRRRGRRPSPRALTLSPRVELDRAEADRWARTLTDIRLMVGTRIGLEDDDSEVPEGLVGEIYHWLTELQGGIIAALDGGLSDGGLGCGVRSRMSLELTAEEFEKVVIEELDALPDEMVDGLDNLVFVTEDRPEDGSLDLLGIYEGIALTERDRYGFGELPDRIVLFREPLLEHLRRPGRTARRDPRHARARDRPLLRHRRRGAAPPRLGVTRLSTSIGRLARRSHVTNRIRSPRVKEPSCRVAASPPPSSSPPRCCSR